MVQEKNMTQDQKLAYLVEAFKEDSREYRNLVTPGDREGKQRLLRSLMNIRMSGEMAAETIKVQDACLEESVKKAL